MKATLRRDLARLRFVRDMRSDLRTTLLAGARHSAPIDSVEPVGLDLVRVWFSRPQGRSEIPSALSSCPWILPVQAVVYLWEPKS